MKQPRNKAGQKRAQSPVSGFPVLLDKAERCCERLTTIGALLRAAGLGKSRLSDEVIEPEVVAQAGWMSWRDCACARFAASGPGKVARGTGALRCCRLWGLFSPLCASDFPLSVGEQRGVCAAAL